MLLDKPSFLGGLELLLHHMFASLCFQLHCVQCVINGIPSYFNCIYFLHCNRTLIQYLTH
jgi:hypothetical protein